MGVVWLRWRAEMQLPAVRMRFAADVRLRWRAWLALALLIGVLGGAVIAAAAGARRTDTAFPRLLHAGLGADVLVSPNGTGLTGYSDAVGRLPGVVADAQVVLYNLAPPGPHGSLDTSLQLAAGTDSQLLFTMARPKILAGRLFRPDRADEIVVDPQLATRFHLRPGSRFTAFTYRGNFGHTSVPQGAPVLFRVTGIVVFDNQVVPVAPSDSAPMAVTSPAFYRLTQRADPNAKSVAARYGPALFGADGAFLRVRSGTDISALHQEVDALAARYPDTGGSVFFANLDSQAASVQRSIHPEVVALTLFALSLGLVGLVVAGQLLSRQAALDAADDSVLRSLGVDVRQLFSLTLVRSAAVALVASAVAGVVAILASPLTPIGPARAAEPQPGIEFNAAFVLLGMISVAVVSVVLVTPSAWRLARAPQPLEGQLGRSRAAVRESAGIADRIVGSAGRPLPAILGIRMAARPGVEGGGLPSASAVVGTTVALVALVGAFVFGASLHRLVSTPVRYGQSWNITESSFGALPEHLAGRIAIAAGRVEGYSGGALGQVTIAGRLVTAVGIDRLHGDVFPTLLKGRAPARRDEIVLGATTMRLAHTSVGERVDVVNNGVRTKMRVVGEAVFPAFGLGNFDPTDLGQGAATVASLLAPPSVKDPSVPGYNLLLVRLSSGVGTGPAAARVLTAIRQAGCPPGACSVATMQRPTEIDDYSRVRQTPLVLAALLALLGVVTLGYLLVTSIRRHRKEFAILKTLGLLRRDVSAVVACQASALTGIALLVGVPVGLAVGHWVWALFADSVGVSSDASAPLLTVAIVVPAALAVANLMAAGPAWRAGHIRPAVALRSE